MSSQHYPSDYTFNYGVDQFIRTHVDYFASWDIPKREFRYFECPDEIQAIFRQLRSHNVIERTHTDGEYGVYQIPEAKREKLQHLLDETDRTTLPCGHGGFRNLGNDQFTCGFDHCQQKFGRETVAEVWG